MFEFFRRYQKKLLAFMAVFAMVAFTLDFSLFRNQLGSGGPNPTVAKLYGRNVKQNDLYGLLMERQRANRFISLAIQRPDVEFFGPLDTRSLVDAVILQHEADRLGIPASKDLAVAWLRQQFGERLTTQAFDAIYRQYFADQVTDEQLLTDLANQIRLNQVMALGASAPVTPLDVFETYKDQEERVSAKVVPFAAQQFVAETPQPTDTQIQAFYDQYNDQLPDPERSTPGFKRPQRVVVESAAVDTQTLSETLREKLTTEDLRKIFESRKEDFPIPPPELPASVFAGAPELTPNVADPFRDVRADVARLAAREYAEDIANRVSNTLSSKTLAPFVSDYLNALEANSVAEETGKGAAAQSALPEPGTRFEEGVAAIRKDPAATLDVSDDPTLGRLIQGLEIPLTFERTPEIGRQEAALYGGLGRARRGSNTSFVDLMFDTKRDLYEEEELADDLGNRYVVWKIKDVPEAVPPLDEIRDQVASAWRLDQARGLAKKAAEEFAAKAREAGGDIDAAAQPASQTVINTTPMPKMISGGFLGGGFQQQPPRPSPIPQLPDAGPELREAIFDVQAGTVTIAPNRSESIFYVVGLNSRTPVAFEYLYSDLGPRFGMEMSVQSESNSRQFREWMETLRARAGLPTDWIPPDEKERMEREGIPTQTG